MLQPIYDRARIVSFCVFIFYLLALTVPSGYSYGSAALLIVALFFLFQKPSLVVTTEDRVLMGILLAIFIVSSGAVLMHGDRLKLLDQTSRCLLVIPILLVLRHTILKPGYLWAGMAAGALGAGAIALWQMQWLDYNRAEGFLTTAIPFGDMSLAMSFFCIAGLLWANKQNQVWKWRLFLMAGALAAFYALVASSTRGAWLAMPPALILFGIAFLSMRNLKIVAAVGVAFILLAGALIRIPGNLLEVRYHEAQSSLDDYLHSRSEVTDVGIRLEAWRAALQGIGEKPLLGWSHNDYAEHLRRSVDEEKIAPVVSTLSNTHNNFLEVWLHQGIFGLLSFLALFVVPFYVFCKRLRASNNTVRVYAVCGVTLVSSFFMFGTTQVILGRNNGIMFFLITLVVLWAGMKNEEEAERPHDDAYKPTKSPA